MKPHLRPKAVELYREAVRRSTKALSALTGGQPDSSGSKPPDKLASLVAEDRAALTGNPALSIIMGHRGRSPNRQARRTAAGPTLDQLHLLAEDDPRAREMLDLVEARQISATQALIRLGARRPQTGYDRLRSAWKNASETERQTFLAQIRGNAGEGDSSP